MPPTLVSSTPPARRTPPRAGAGEDVWANKTVGASIITVCVPAYHDDAALLIDSLRTMQDADQIDLLILDDGSDDKALTARLKSQLEEAPFAARLITAHKNRGRSDARNRLAELADCDWLLFLDADMQPDDERFLSRYLEAMKKPLGPALIAGGFSLKQVKSTRETALHEAQSQTSECLDAATRNRAPGRYVFSSNILVHRDVLDAVPFDPGYQGWGWEDIDWGLSIAARYPVLHIDNPATHLGLVDTDTLLEKFGGSGRNFAHLARRHPEAVQQMPLYRMARRFRHLPAKGALQALTRWGARNSRLPDGLRLVCLKTFRAIAYSKDLT
ncbi:MAG: family 2 glycosyl transferase [Henriciella sp.]|nr:glycosyltransferase family A protein [Henriciella sp.]MBK74267.1 family 2 glycosyl transferase [Henriciella sp.]